MKNSSSLPLPHAPAECETTFTFAAVSFRTEGEMFWNYRFLACEGTRHDAAASNSAAMGSQMKKGRKARFQVCFRARAEA